VESIKDNSIGAVWVKSGQYGDYLSISLEIDGTKHNYTAFANKYKQEGDKKPNFRIMPPKTDSKPSSQDDKYNAQLENIMAQRAANAAKLATSASYNQPATFTEDDLPF